MNNESNEKILYKDEGYTIQGAIFEVYRVMGNGFVEAAYQECLQREFELRVSHFRRRSNYIYPIRVSLLSNPTGLILFVTRRSLLN